MSTKDQLKVTNEGYVSNPAIRAGRKKEKALLNDLEVIQVI